MGTPIDLPILFSNIPAVAKIASPEFANPDVHRAMLEPTAQEFSEALKNQVQEIEKTEGAEAADKDGRNRQDRKRRRRRKAADSEHEVEPETAASNASPWTGNILNLKI